MGRVPDRDHHRIGEAISEELGTPGGLTITESEWPACITSMESQWGPGVLGFSVTNTARDLGELIRATRSSDDEVFVYALSYGTYLANRYLQLYPDQSSGVVLDSICGPEECRSSKADERFDAVVHRYFDTCAQDAFCNARLGDDPWSRFGAVRDALEAGHCPEATNAGLNRDADSSRTAGG